MISALPGENINSEKAILAAPMQITAVRISKENRLFEKIPFNSKYIPMPKIKKYQNPIVSPLSKPFYKRTSSIVKSS